MGHSLIILGPLLDEKEIFKLPFLISLCPSLKSSDGEVELYRVFKLQLPNAVHLCCFCTSDKINKSQHAIFYCQIYEGKCLDTTEGIHEAGLVDGTSKELFDKKLEVFRVQWDEVSPHRHPSFFEWILKKPMISKIACFVFT